ncbi:MAG: radical SAM protein [Bacteroidetes bacterium]|mgnify:CR=1 FL=1|nr:radical SAM protein [Bacteroidota bacterium]
MDSTQATKSMGGYFHIDSENASGKWHLRFGVTPNCNFFCRYCAPEGGFPQQKVLPFQEVVEILEAAYSNGINRVHWTGGEPTLRTDIIECMGKAKEIGYKEQIITTNGYRLSKDIDKMIANGLSRVILSLDTLIAERFHEVTGVNIFEKVLSGLEQAVKKLSTPTKMSCCTMRSTLSELRSFVEYANMINSRNDNAGRMIIKLNQFFPSNPAQLEEKGSEYWKNEVVEDSEILKKLGEIGELIPINRTHILGDNPSYNYYKIGNYDVIVGVLAMYTWKYRCGGCHKLRVKPNGKVSICMDYPEADVMLAGKPLDDKIESIKNAMNFRETDLESIRPIEIRKHYNNQLGSQRFGAIGTPKPMEVFYPQTIKH